MNRKKVVMHSGYWEPFDTKITEPWGFLVRWSQKLR